MSGAVPATGDIQVTGHSSDLGFHRCGAALPLAEQGPARNKEYFTFFYPFWAKHILGRARVDAATLPLAVAAATAAPPRAARSRTCPGASSPGGPRSSPATAARPVARAVVRGTRPLAHGLSSISEPVSRYL